jgi:hypothetical protein
MEGRHVVEEPRVHEVVRVGAGLGAVLGRAVEEAPTALTVCRKVGTLRSYNDVATGFPFKSR